MTYFLVSVHLKCSKTSSILQTMVVLHSLHTAKSLLHKNIPQVAPVDLWNPILSKPWDGNHLLLQDVCPPFTIAIMNRALRDVKKKLWV